MGLRAVIAGCCVALGLGWLPGCAGVRLRRDVEVQPSSQGPSRQDLSHAATVAMDRHDFAQAKTDLELLLQQAPRSAELHFRLGKVLQFQDRLIEAEAEYKKALKIDADYVDALVGLGQVDARLGRPEAALERFEEAIGVDPHQAEAHLARGRTLEVLNRPNDALKAYFRSLELDPTLAPAMVRVAVLQLERGQGDQALVRLEQADLLTPEDPEILYRKGLILLALGQSGRAVEDLSSAAKRAPARADILVGLARAYKADRRPDQARLALDQARLLQPELPVALEQLESIRR